VTERGRRVYALLRTLNAWVPPPPAGRHLASKTGFASDKSRYITCPDCLTNDHPEGMKGCETCGGRGEIPDPGPDPYRKKATGFYAEREQHREADRRRDQILREIAQDERVRAGLEAAPDHLVRAIEARDIAWRYGSYLELARALEDVRDANPSAYAAAIACAHTLGDAPVDPPKRLEAVCELLAARMPERIRVPAEVPVWTRDELVAQAAGMRERATWRGRRDPLARERRNLAIRTFALEGMTAAEISARVGVHRRTVERVLQPKEEAA